MNPVRTSTARPTSRPPRDRLNLDPSTAYEVLTRRMVEDLTREVTAIRGRIDTLFWVIIASVAADVLMRLTA